MNGARANNFDSLRLAGACMVVLGHSFILTGEAPHAYLGHSVSTLGVLIFFAISGYLITRSWMNDPHVIRFTLRRARRILPALAFVVLISVFVLGLALTPLRPWEYLTHPHTTRYFGNMVLYVSYTLPLVFAENKFPHAVNGSLWTLPVEAGMYALTPLLVLLGRWRLALLANLALAIGLGVYSLTVRPTPIVFAGSEFWSAALLAPFFVAGSLIARMRLERWLNPWVGLAALAALHFASLGPGLREALLCIVLPYAVLAIGLGSAPFLRSAGRWGDFSYGIYLWSFPLQQLAVHLFGTASGGWGNFAVAMPASLVMGVISWHLIEKFFLRSRNHQGLAGEARPK